MKFISLHAFDLSNYGYPEITVLIFFTMLLALGFLLLLSKILRKDPIEIPRKEFENLDYDVLQSQSVDMNYRKVNITTKITVFMLSGILMYTPLKNY